MTNPGTESQYSASTELDNTVGNQTEPKRETYLAKGCTLPEDARLDAFWNEARGALPDVVNNTGQPAPAVGDAIILINYDGTPAIFVRTINIEEVPTTNNH